MALKTSHIAPIYKGRDQDLPKNYRPVTLTSHLRKTFEKVAKFKHLCYGKNEHLKSNSSYMSTTVPNLKEEISKRSG